MAAARLRVEAEPRPESQPPIDTRSQLGTPGNQGHNTLRCPGEPQVFWGTLDIQDDPQKSWGPSETPSLQGPRGSAPK